MSHCACLPQPTEFQSPSWFSDGSWGSVQRYISYVSVPHTGDHAFKVIAPKLWSSLYRAVFPYMLPFIFGHICMYVHMLEWTSDCMTEYVSVCLNICTYFQHAPFISTMKHFVTVCFENCYVNKVIPVVIISISINVINTLQHSPKFLLTSQSQKNQKV